LSRTSAVHTVIAALGIGPGDEVVVGPITDHGSVAGIFAHSAKAVFPDVDDALAVDGKVDRRPYPRHRL
jgi:dTDP-4-amino-4,6-dideoxygalactose transaminase